MYSLIPYTQPDQPKDPADALVEEMRKHYADNWVMLFCKGTQLLHSDHYTQAQEVLRLAAQANPNHEGILQNLGVAYFQTKDFDRAEPYFRAVVKVKPEKVHFANLAILLKEKGQIKRAQQVFEQSRELNGELSHPSWYLNIFGISYAKEEKYDHAIGVFVDALKIDHTNYAAWRNLGKVLSMTGKPNLSKRAYQFARTHNPNPQADEFRARLSQIKQKTLEMIATEEAETFQTPKKHPWYLALVPRWLRKAS